MPRIDPADIAWRSHWLQQALADDAGLEPPLRGDARADVAIVGGGFLGLWTAIRLKEHDPSLDVVIVERDICGGARAAAIPGWSCRPGRNSAQSQPCATRPPQ
jgi:hypothetical protein